MVVLTVSSITYLVLIALAPILLWKNANRLNEILAVRKQLQQSAKRARDKFRRVRLQNCHYSAG